MRVEKQLLLDEIKEKIDDSKSFIITRYQELTSDKARGFRDILAEAEAEFEVVKKRVFAKAIESSGIKFEGTALEGHIGVIFTKEEATAASKVAIKYSEDNGNIIKFVGGHIDGEVCSGEDIEAMAKLPSLPELRAQVVGLFEAPASQTLAVIQSILTSPLYCIEAKSKKG